VPGKRKRTASPSRVGELQSFLLRASELGAARAKVIEAASVVVAEWVRLKCRFGCSGYGSSHCCPPHSPEPETTRRVVGEYRRAILVEAGAHKPREIVPELERELFLAGYYKALAMASGPCRLCRSCDPEEPCRYPERARPAMEACGIDVFSTVRAAGWEIEVVRSEEDTPHYFGLVLVD
jgi:predicted metal-binding protein